MDTLKTNKTYTKRNIGDNVNGAILVKRINTRLWEMRCPCGEMFVAQPSNTNGRCSKCGYMAVSLSKSRHNESPRQGKNASRLYRIWLGMRTRCNNPNNHGYRYYGARGIKVCAEWDVYENFKNWALVNGYRDDLSIDRANNNGNYEPDNCRWVTQAEQNRNKRTHAKENTND